MENTTNEVKELTTKLEQGINGIYHSGDYQKMLQFYSRFHHYSINNLLLIYMQRPDASLVAGFQTWKKNKRYVKRGEHGIRILAPCPHTVTVNVKDDQGNETQEQKTFTSFKAVSVFDISQTDGEPIPEVVHKLSASLENYDAALKTIMSESDVPISFEQFDREAYGYYSKAENRIVIKPGLPESQTIKTLIHERAHSLLHTEDTTDRSTAEIEAESVAYVVSSYFGLDTSEYSFGYVAEWSRTEDTKQLKESMSRIQKAAAYLIDQYKAGTVGTANNSVPEKPEPKAEPKKTERKEEPKQELAKAPSLPDGISEDGLTIHLEQGRAYCNVNINGLLNLNMTDLSHFLKCWPLTEEQRAYIASKTKDTARKALFVKSAKVPKDVKAVISYFKSADALIINRDLNTVWLTDCYTIARLSYENYKAYFAGFPDVKDHSSMRRSKKSDDFAEGCFVDCISDFYKGTWVGCYFKEEREASLNGKANDRYYDMETETGTRFNISRKPYEFISKIGSVKAKLRAKETYLIMAESENVAALNLGMILKNINR